MDGQRFDDLSRTFAAGHTRRAALRLLLGGAAGGALALLVGARPGSSQHELPTCRAACGFICGRGLFGFGPPGVGCLEECQQAIAEGTIISVICQP